MCQRVDIHPGHREVQHDGGGDKREEGELEDAGDIDVQVFSKGNFQIDIAGDLGNLISISENNFKNFN